MRNNNSKTSHKILASVALVAAAAGVAGLGTFGGFTSTTSASANVNSGTVKIDLDANSARTGLTVDTLKLVPGDTVQRVASLGNAGDQDFGSVTMTTTSKTHSILTSDVTNGLQLEVDACSVPWQQESSSPTFTCPGTTSVVRAQGPILASNQSLGVLNALNHGQRSYLRFTGTLPSSAGNDFQGKSDTVDFSFDATQRAGTAR